MHIGIQLIAPDGFQLLEKGEVYHLLRNDARRERVLLVHFLPSSQGYEGTLVILNRSCFESALVDGLIAPCPAQSMLPPWLTKLEGVALKDRDRRRRHAKKSHFDRINERYQHIKPLIERLDEVLAADFPDKIIARHARVSKPQQNEKRLQLWFYAFLCFGRDPWVLMPPFHKCGTTRKPLRADQKMGRRSLTKGAHHGYGCDEEMIEKIKTAYQKYCGLGVSMKTIYAKAMTEKFGCHVRRNANGAKTYYHPAGNPFPSYDQFRYRVEREFGRNKIQRIRYGEARMRTRLSASEGPYSEAVANLLERVELDCFYVLELPRGPIEGNALPPLGVVRGRCVGSGKLVGIGFSLGNENHTAYRMMLFCMAIDKRSFGRLFGLEIVHEDWSGAGMSPHLLTDRGPGAKQAAEMEPAAVSPIRGFAPAWSGQSKATIESSHPRNTELEGAPSYVTSELNPVQLARREIERLIHDNQALNVSPRLTPEMVAARVVPCPNGIWNYLNDRARTDATSIPFDTAVRWFLTPIEVKIKNDGAYFHEQRYDSNALRDTGLVDRVAAHGEVTVVGYLLDLCVRYIWVEVDEQIIELQAKLAIRDDDEQLYMSLEELVEFASEKRRMASEFRVHQHAVGSEYVQRVKQATGRLPDAGQRKSGRAKAKSARARQETADLRQYTSQGRKKA